MIFMSEHVCNHDDFMSEHVCNHDDFMSEHVCNHDNFHDQTSYRFKCHDKHLNFFIFYLIYFYEKNIKLLDKVQT